MQSNSVPEISAAPESPICKRPLGYLACALAGSFWGLGFFFGKTAFSQLSVMQFVFYRFLFACAGLVPFVRRPHFTSRQWKLLVFAAFLGIPLQFLIQFKGLDLTTVSHAALMVGTMPVILAIGATLFAHEHLDLKGWFGLFGSTAGVALIVLSSRTGIAHGGNLWGDLLVVISLLIALAWVLINQRLMQEGNSPLSVTAWGIFSGTAMLVIAAPVSGPLPVHGIRITVWLAVAASGLLSTAASTLLWNSGINRVPASRAAVFLNIEPALGTILGVTLLGDRLGPGAWIGGLLIITAAIILTSTGQQATMTDE